jgi:hypothetical protein
MLLLIGQRLRDPDRTIFHRALRLAIVLPPLFWFGLHVLRDPQFALIAAFGSFAALGMADFMGPRRSRLIAHLMLGLVGTVLVVAGTALSNTLWPAVVAMLVVGVILQFAMALGGQFALGNNSAILAFVVAVMVPAGEGAIGSRVAGWITAMVCSALIATFLWPRHERRDLYQRVADACRSLAAVAHAIADGVDPDARMAAGREAFDRLRDAQRALDFRPTGPPGHQEALVGLVDALGEGWRFSRTVASTGILNAADRDLVRAIAATLNDVANVAQACVAGSTGAVLDVEALIAARHAHRALRDAAAAQALASNAPGTAVVSEFSAVFPIRVLSYITLSMAVDAIVLTGRSVHVDDDFMVVQVTPAEGTLRNAANLLLPHFAPRSVWFRNCLRAGLALALSVLVAKVSDIGHAFWVVLATLSILRSNVATTGSTIVSALVGTLAGFVLASAAITVLGPHPLWLWLSLPFAVFLAGYAPAAISFGAGQAMFALLVVELFNLMVPEGWEVGAVRLEAVAVGAVVALVASLIMWPKGASAALRGEVAAYIRAGQRLAEAAFNALIGRADTTQVASARNAALDARHRADEAFAAYLGERGEKHVPLDVWGWLVRMPIVMRVAADAAIAMLRTGYHGVETGDAARLFNAAVMTMSASYGELADRLEDSRRAPDPALQAAIADLDMIDGAGKQRAAILAATGAYAEAHRGDPETISRVMALTWGVGWLAYLANIRLRCERMLGEAASQGETPWWR